MPTTPDETFEVDDILLVRRVIPIATSRRQSKPYVHTCTIPNTNPARVKPDQPGLLGGDGAGLEYYGSPYGSGDSFLIPTDDFGAGA